MKTTQLILGLAVIAISSLTVSCKKTNRNNAAEVVQQNNLAESAFMDFAYMAEQVSKGPLYFSTFNADCSTLKYDTTGIEVLATIDYGPENCTCNDGKIRKGKIMINYPIQYDTIGAVFTTTLSEYYVNGSKIEGTRTATSISNTDIKEVMTATVTPDTEVGSITWNSTKNRKFIENTNSANILAGRNHEVTGSSSGITARGDDYNIEITTVLKVQSGCRSIKSGIMTVTSSYFKNEATVDYGSGDCDKEAVLTYDKKNVILHL